MIKNNKEMKRDWGVLIAFLSVASVFLGSTLVKIDISLFQIYPLRLFGLLSIILIIVNKGWADHYLDSFFKFTLFFFVLGLISIAWAPDTTLAIREFGILQTGIGLTWLMAKYIDTEDRIDMVIKIWIIGSIFVNLIGFWEATTHKFLIVTEVGGRTERLAERIGFLAPRSIFVNQNNYAFFNSITALVLLGKIMKPYKSLLFTLLNWIALALSLYLLVSSYSRAAIASFVFAFSFFVLFSLFTNNSYKSNLLKLIIIVVTCFSALLIVNDDLLDSLENKLNAVVEKNEGAAEDSRVTFYYKSIDYSLENLGFGMGPGSSMINLGGIPPHSFFIQVLVEYGFLIIIGIIWTLLTAFYKFHRYQNVGEDALPIILKASILAFPLMSVGPSSIIGEGIFWLWLGFIVSYSSILYRKYNLMKYELYSNTYANK